MKISKKEALQWFEYLITLNEDEQNNPVFMDIVFSTLSQIELAERSKIKRLISNIKDIKSLSGQTLYVGDDQKFPKGCASCLLKDGLSPIRKTNKCNANCKFCYYYGEIDNQTPVPEAMWDIGGTLYYEDDIDLILSNYGSPSSVAYVYLEPFIEIEKYFSIIRKLNARNIHQHLYTNGILANETNLRMLGEAGLDELRFNVGATNCSDKVIENIRIAKKYIKYVGIETPMTPDFFDAFCNKKRSILNTKLDFINCAELHLNKSNIANYLGENMYMNRQGYISPIWSRELTLKFMKMASDESWDLVVHDCSNDTKFARNMHQCASQGCKFGNNSYCSEFETIPLECFIPISSDNSFHFMEEEELKDEFKLNKYLATV